MYINKIERIRYLLLAAQREGARRLAAHLKELAVTASQAEAIRILGTSGELSINQLGERLICEGGNPSRLVATLVRKGFVETSSHKKDQRASLIRLTTKGRQLAEQIQLKERDFYAELDAVLNTKADIESSLLSLLSGTRYEKALVLRGILSTRTNNKGEAHEIY